jgi:hypothetical protein
MYPRCLKNASLARRVVLAAFGLFLLLGGVALSARAQNFTGSISGRVTDPSGNPVAAVEIAVIENATSETFRTVTNDLGEYNVSFLKPATYRVTFTAQGFKAAIESDLQLELNQNFRLNRTLSIGSVNETVEVSADLSLLNYDSPEIAHVIGSEQLENIPELAVINRGRSPFLLAKLIPGVTSTSSNNSNINNFSFGGGRPVTNEILIDGLPTTNPSDNTYTFTPSPDSVDEFKVITTPFSAELGHTGGGVLLATTKHGTNDFHGSVYDYFRNRILNARNFFAGPNNERYIENDPGFTLGGPVLLPHYNGRNKTFFFADYNVTYAATPATPSANGNEGTLSLTPTDAERSGDFSAVPGIKIYDPATTVVTTGPGGSLIVTRQQFPNNIIPANRIDPVAAQIVKFFPEPNGSFSGGANYLITATQYQQTWQGLIRIDQNFGDNDKLFARYGRYHPNSDAVQFINNAANNNNAGGWWDNQVGVGETHVFTPRVINDFRVAFVQEINYDSAGGPPVPQLGLQGVTLNAFPDISTSNFIPLGAGGADHDRDRSWVFNDDLQIQRGRHLFKVGGDFRRQMYHFYNPGLLSGSYTFDQTFTSISSDPNSGSDLADLLLGLPTQTQIQTENYTYRENINSASLYFQDDFKVNQRLTLNLGLRWEFDGPYSEANNRFGSFNPNIVNSQTGNLGDVQFAGQDGAPTHFMPNIYRDFLPRVGFAWNALKDTVVRGGVSFLRLPNLGFFNYGPISPFVQNSLFQSADGVTPAYQLDQGVPQAPFFADANGNPLVPASLTNPTSVATWIDGRDRTPYNIAWEFGLQRQFGSWFAELDYAASRGIKLPIVITADQLQPSQFNTGSQALRPFPQYADVQHLTMDGDSIYHSLQAKLEHRWKNGFVLSAAYTFSKLIDDVDPVSRVTFAPPQNVYDLKADRGVGAYDIPQRFVANYVYSLPFGRGARYANSTRILKDIISGWELSGITELQKGQPIAITQPNTTNGFTESQRPNIVGNPVLSSGQTLAHWFNTAAFQLAPVGTLGDSPRFPLHGPGLNNTDLALQRNFILRERVKLQLRGEFFNSFNHPQFSNPNGDVASSSFGKITSALPARITEIVLRIFF